MKFLLSLLPSLLAFATAVSVSRDATATTTTRHDNHNHRTLFDPNEVNADQPSYLAQQELLTNGTIDWEWVIIRINSVSGLENADWFGQADPIITVTSDATLPQSIEFYNDQSVTEFTFRTLQGTDTPLWYELGLVAFERGSASTLTVSLKDDDGLGIREDLLEQTVALNTTTQMDTWVDVALTEGDYALNISLWRSTTPIKTQQDQENMGLTELLFDLEDGSVASLVYKINPNNNKAVLYFPGRSDSFAHPHVLAMYEELGYDFYSLDARYCGRTRRFMKDTLFGHWIDSFDTYHEEIGLTMDFMKNQTNYSTIITHVHSTGVLMALNYAMFIQETTPGMDDPFDGYILNAPFLDWGHVGGVFNEFILENTGITDVFGMENAAEGGGIGAYHLRTWFLYQYNTTERPLIQAHTTADWAKASTSVQRKISESDAPVTSSPVLLIASLGDDVLLASESEARMAQVSSNYSIVILTNNGHDVTYSYIEELTNDAIGEISTWLKTGETSGMFSDTSSARIILTSSRGLFWLTIVSVAAIIPSLGSLL